MVEWQDEAELVLGEGLVHGVQKLVVLMQHRHLMTSSVSFSVLATLAKRHLEQSFKWISSCEIVARQGNRRVLYTFLLQFVEPCYSCSRHFGLAHVWSLRARQVWTRRNSSFMGPLQSTIASSKNLLDVYPFGPGRDILPTSSCIFPLFLQFPSGQNPLGLPLEGL